FPKDHGTDGVTVAFNESFSPNTIVCYVDASYNPKSVNGIDTAACAGFFGEEHPLNFSILLNVETKKKLSNMDKDARATYLEILATKTALERLFNWKYRPEEVIIRSDSLNMIRGLNLKLKGARFGQIREEILLLMDVASKFQRPILFQHVYGHNGDPGNETADAMARFTMKHGVELEGTMMERDDERTKYCKHPKEISHDERTIPSDPKKQGISRWAKRLKKTKPLYQYNSPNIHTFDDIRQIQRPLDDISTSPLAMDLLWADPMIDLIGFMPNQVRGVSVYFGESEVVKLCKSLNIDLIVRAHQMMQNGYGFFCGRKLMTIFTAPRYFPERNNKAAVLVVDENGKCSIKVLLPCDEINTGEKAFRKEFDLSYMDSSSYQFYKTNGKLPKGRRKG
ncbi:unnamed protein product, partial [Mesorhabditis belari]